MKTGVTYSETELHATARLQRGVPECTQGLKICNKKSKNKCFKQQCEDAVSNVLGSAYKVVMIQLKTRSAVISRVYEKRI